MILEYFFIVYVRRRCSQFFFRLSLLLSFCRSCLFIECVSVVHLFVYSLNAFIVYTKYLSSSESRIKFMLFQFAHTVVLIFSFITCSLLRFSCRTRHGRCRYYCLPFIFLLLSIRRRPRPYSCNIHLSTFSVSKKNDMMRERD